MIVTKSRLESSWVLFLLWTLTVLIAIASLRFLVLGVPVAMPHMEHHELARPIMLFLHLVPAPIALALLPLQFSQKIRAGRPKLHRWLGRLYAACILVSGLSSLGLAATAAAGPVAGAGFGLLAVFWLGTTGRAVQLAIQRRINEHRRWMIRSAALTLAAVTLRLYIFLAAVTVGIENAYVLIAWACWVPNALFAEWLLRRHQAPQPA